MSKHQKGNREAKKPKQAAKKPPQPENFLVVPAPGSRPTGGKR